MSGSLKPFLNMFCRMAVSAQQEIAQMDIAYSGRIYRAIRDEDGFPLVIVHQRDNLWRVASPSMTLIVLAGLAAPPLTMFR